jgi:hypothetical protein
MHYKKNVCDNLLKFIFGEKDTMVIWRDMEEVGISLNFGYNKWPMGHT